MSPFLQLFNMPLQRVLQQGELSQSALLFNLLGGRKRFVCFLSGNEQSERIQSSTTSYYLTHRWRKIHSFFFQRETE